MPKDHDGRTFIQIGRIRVYVGTDGQCDAAAMTVCGNASYFADDVHAICAGCGAPIVHRPTAPPRPPKLCVDCAIVVLRDHRRPH